MSGRKLVQRKMRYLGFKFYLIPLPVIPGDMSDVSDGRRSLPEPLSLGLSLVEQTQLWRRD